MCGRARPNADLARGVKGFRVKGLGLREIMLSFVLGACGLTTLEAVFESCGSWWVRADKNRFWSFWAFTLLWVVEFALCTRDSKRLT